MTSIKPYSITSLTPKLRDWIWHLTPVHLRAWLVHTWRLTARPDQLADSDWAIWLLLGGRGSGKTRTGAEWVRQRVRDGARHIALVAPTFNEAREVMLEGESGLLNIGYPAERPHFAPSRRRLEWPSGAVGHLYSAEDPDGLRGAQFDTAWADEFCAWHYPDATLSNLRLALRLGDDPRLVVTTTPKPTPSLIALTKVDGVRMSRSRTAENMRHLAPGFAQMMEDSYGGKPLGRQELDGEIVTELPGALWTLAGIAAGRRPAPEQLDRIVIAVDPPAGSGPRADACGIVVAGRAGTDIFVLEDASLRRAAPADWADRAVGLYHSYRADTVLAEVNQGGDMVTACLRQSDPLVPVLARHANRGKRARAEPVAQLYRRGRVFHAGRFDALEAEMCLMGTDALKHSPDRVDALVWAITELMDLDTRPQARVRWA